MQRNWTEDRNGLPRTSWDEGPFEVVIQCKIDESPDTSWMGEWCNAGKPGAIPRNPANVAQGCYTHFLPTQPERGAEDLAYMERINSGDVVFIGVIATAHCSGVELGQDALWGVKCGGPSSLPHIHEVAEDCAARAIRYARKTLESLRRVKA